MSLLKSTQKNEQEELSFSQLQEWLQQRSREVVEQNNLSILAVEQVQILEGKRCILESQLEIWRKKTRLHSSANEVIPFYRETQQILDLLHFSNQPTLWEVLAVNQELEKRLHTLIEKIEGSTFLQDFSFILEENAPAETNPLISLLLDIDALRKKFDLKITESRYNAIQVISSKAEYLNLLLTHLQQLNQGLELKKSRLASAQQKQEEKGNSLQQLRGDKKNLDINELTKRKKKLEHKLEEKETEIISFFSKIKPLLQKYKEIEPTNGLLFSYLKDPLSSFFQDEGLFVVDILTKIGSFLREGKLNLSQKDMLASISALEGIYNQRLQIIKTEYKELEDELKEVTSKIQQNYFVIKMDDAAYRLEHYIKQAKRMEEEISLLEEKSAKLQYLLKREQEEVQSLIKVTLSKDVLINVGQK